MRAGGGCSVHHRLSPEATIAVQQAVSLARRRGHSQVTPLHVALTLLTSDNLNLLRNACRKSQSHSQTNSSQSFQLRTLEFCFNVALNRLPTSCHEQQHGSLQQRPSLSNALVAVFKRAQANQRRGGSGSTAISGNNNGSGCFDNTNSHQNSIKVEIEQLIISILDDPSVSRVMREAGFSSPQLKQCVEEDTSHTHKKSSDSSSSAQQQQPMYRHLSGDVSQNACRTNDTDVSAVLEGLLGSKRWRNTVVVGECLATAESVVKETMKRLNTSKVPEALRGVEFINPQLSLSWFKGATRFQTEERLLDLNKAMMRSAWEGRGAILYLGDLRWALEGLSDAENGGGSFYCPVRHVVLELGRMVACHAQNRRVWGLATATYQTYVHLRNSHNSATYLDILCAFHPVIVPAGSLSLSLSLDTSMPWDPHSSIPRCLQTQDPMSKRFKPAAEILSKWAPTCCILHDRSPQILHHFAGKNIPAPMLQPNLTTPTTATRTHKTQCLDNNPLMNPEADYDDQTAFLDLALINGNNNGSSHEIMSSYSCYDRIDAESFKRLCRALEQKVPSMAGGEMTHGIASAVLMSRSGMKRKQATRSTWFLFLGPDEPTKSLMIKALAQVIFGSESKVFHVPTTENNLQGLLKAASMNPDSVFVLEEMENCDPSCLESIARALETGIFAESENSEEISLSESIVVMKSLLACDEVETNNNYTRCRAREEQLDQAEDRYLGSRVESNNFSLDLNISIQSNSSATVSVVPKYFTSMAALRELVDFTVVFK